LPCEGVKEVIVDLLDALDAAWKKSTRTVTNGCVEVAFVDGQLALRESKNKDRAVLVFAPRGWNAIIGGARGGAFGLPPGHRPGVAREVAPLNLLCTATLVGSAGGNDSALRRVARGAS
jgi:hypothetical protein